MGTPMEPEQVFDTARKRARELPWETVQGPPDVAAERLRTDCAKFFDAIPDPPLYRRLNDPARAAAEALVPKGEELLVQCLALGRDAKLAEELTPLRETLQSFVAALCHVGAGRLREAELAWQRARQLERSSVSLRRLWASSDEAPRPVYDRESQVSRFDPRPEPQLRVKLPCPNGSCQRAAEYRFSPRYATQEFACPFCQMTFVAYFGEARTARAERVGTRTRHMFQVEELTHARMRVEFEDATDAELNVARGDLLAFLYTVQRQLRAAVNLSSGRVLWVTRGAPCFLATAVFGVDAPELVVFRDFRDRALVQSSVGMLLVRAYERHGEHLSRAVRRHPRLRLVVRAGLGYIYRWLWRSGFR
jgi:hypothetical protein